MPLVYQDILMNGYKWVIVLQLRLIFLWILYIAIHAIRNYKNQRVFYWGWIIALILVSSQVITGMTVVLTQLNLYLALLHSLFITLLFGLLTYMILLVSRSRISKK